MAFTNAHIIPVEGPEVQRGTLLVQNGKILAVGASVEVPKDALVQDCSNQVIMPGLICTHSHIGAGADRSGPIQFDARIIDALNPRSSGWKRALAGGLTSLNVMPGSGIFSSQTVYLKLRPGVGTIGEMAGCSPMGRPWVASKWPMAQPRSSAISCTRSKAAALVRQKYLEPQKYQRDLGHGRWGQPHREILVLPLVEALEGSVWSITTHRADDIVTVFGPERDSVWSCTM